MANWLLKTEPGDYSWDDLVRDGRTVWTGVRNPAAQKNLAAMQPGDEVLVYHTGDERRAVGVARVVTAPYADPSAAKGVVVDLEPLRPLAAPVSLAALRGEPAFADHPLLRQPRLSVMPIPPALWQRLLAMAATAAAGG